MADDETDNGDIYPGSREDLVAEIRRMEKEKEELEKKNRERQQLEEQYRQLKRSLKSGSGASGSKASSKGDNRRSQEKPAGTSSELSASLEQSQSHLRELQQQILRSSPVHGTTREKDSGEFLDEFEDDVMSAEHKQALRENRDVLVENMTPDDIFNDLISKHILTNADVSRIKERNTNEAINEELLNVIVRRSDRAFHVFVSSLRRTLQGTLANRLDSGSVQSRNKRKRRTGELNIDIDCERVSPASKDKYTCTCQEVEKQILVMARGAFSNIRRRDASASSFEQFKKELQQTNQVIKDSLDLMNSLKILCRHGDIVDLSEGSVRFTIQCRSFASCQRLWKIYESGELLVLFKKGIITPSLLNFCGAKDIYISVRISRLQYISCALELGYRLLSNEKRAKFLQKKLKRELRSSKTSASENVTPFEGERSVFIGDAESVSPTWRRAFQEIPNNIVTQQTSRPCAIFTDKMVKLRDFYKSTPIVHNEEIRTFSYHHFSKGDTSSHSSYKNHGTSLSACKQNQCSPIHKTRSIMRQKRDPCIDTENLDQSDFLDLKRKRCRSSLKLYNYNLRTRNHTRIIHQISLS